MRAPRLYVLLSLILGTGCPATKQSVECASDDDCPVGSFCAVGGTCRGGAPPGDMSMPGMGDMPLSGDMARTSALMPGWARRFGSPMDDAGASLGFDASGNLLSLSFIGGSMDIDGMAVPFAPLFLTALDRNTAVSRAPTKLNNVPIYKVDRPVLHLAVDAVGDLIVAGSFSQRFDCGNGQEAIVPAFPPSMFVAKLRSDGSCVWMRNYGDFAFMTVTGVATNKGRDVYVAGHYNATLRFGATELPSAGLTDVFIMRFSGDGAPLKVKRFGGPEADRGDGIAIDGTDAVILAGTYGKGISVGTDILPHSGESDVFVAKLDRALDQVTWVQSFGGPSAEEAKGVAVTPGGEVALVGSFQGTVDFDRSTPGAVKQTSAGEQDGFVARLSPLGAVRWARGFGGIRKDEGRAVALDAQGDALVVGVYRDRARFDTGMELVAQAQDFFLARYGGKEGGLLWLGGYGGAGNEEIWGVQVSKLGEVGIIGSTDSVEVRIGTKILAGAGQEDALVAKFVSAAEQPM